MALLILTNKTAILKAAQDYTKGFWRFWKQATKVYEVIFLDI